MANFPPTPPCVPQPLQYIRSLQNFLALVHLPLLAPPHLRFPHYCDTTIRPLPTPRLFAIHYKNWYWQYPVKANAEPLRDAG